VGGHSVFFGCATQLSWQIRSIINFMTISLHHVLMNVATSSMLCFCYDKISIVSLVAV